MPDVGSKLISGSLKVTTAGTSVRLGPIAETASMSVVIYALGTNEGEVVIGGSNVKAKAGSHGTPERIGVALLAKGFMSFDINDPSQIYVDSTVSGDGIGYTALLA